MRPRLAPIMVALAVARGPVARAEAPALSGEPPAALAQAEALSEAFVWVADRVGPSTVHIRAQKGSVLTLGLQQLEQDYQLPPLGADPAWELYTGSGVIVRGDGLVLTNHHVVSGATAVLVTLQDKRVYPARVVGSDGRTDVAVLRIQGEGTFPAAALGDSDALRVGEWVIAVGHPFGLAFSVTAGIVSARGRRNLSSGEFQDYLQTDAVVSPGSSGGPLFNLKGEVVGIVTSIYTTGEGSGQSAGISFAIPSNMAWRVAEELIASGRVARPALGLDTADSPVTLSDPRPGAEVTRVVADGPAEAAGLRRGDVVVALDGEPIAGSDDLRGAVLALGVGARVVLRVERGDSTLELPVVVSAEERLGRSDVAIPADAVRWGGMALVPADSDRVLRQGVTLPEREHRGLLVVAVDDDSPASASGLAPGDILLQVNRRDIESTEQLLRLVAGRRSATVVFWRRGGESLAALGGLEEGR